MKYIKPADNKDIQIRVVIMPDMKDDKPVITTNITIFDKRIKAGEVSSKDMSELEFNKELRSATWARAEKCKMIFSLRFVLVSGFCRLCS